MPAMLTVPRSTRGFSLIEAVVAIGLLTTALVSLAHLLAAAVDTGGLARHATFASILAAQKMEQLLTEPSLDETVGGVEALNAGGTVCEPEPSCVDAVYTRRWRVEAAGGLHGAVTINVAVVHRRGGAGEARLLSVRERVRR